MKGRKRKCKRTGGRKKSKEVCVGEVGRMKDREGAKFVKQEKNTTKAKLALF